MEHEHNDGLDADITLPVEPPEPTTDRPHVPVGSILNRQRALLRMAVICAAQKAKPKDFDVFDRVVMGGMTLAEAGKAEKIAATTARDRYHRAYEVVLKEIRNNPEVREMMDRALAEVGISLDALLAAVATGVETKA